MKKLFFLIASLLLTGAAHAQLGLRLGGSLASLHTSNGSFMHTSSVANLGYQAGITYALPLAPHLAFVPEVQYSDERATLAQQNFGGPDYGFRTDLRQHLRYLSLPLLLRATLGVAYLEAGPQAGLLLSGRQMGTRAESTIAGTFIYNVDYDIASAYRRFDVGPSLGVGVQLPSGLGLSMRAYRGLVTLNHGSSAYEGTYQRQSLQTSLTYQLPARR